MPCRKGSGESPVKVSLDFIRPHLSPSHLNLSRQGNQPTRLERSILTTYVVVYIRHRETTVLPEDDQSWSDLFGIVDDLVGQEKPMAEKSMSKTSRKQSHNETPARSYSLVEATYMRSSLVESKDNSSVGSRSRKSRGSGVLATSL